MPRYRPFLKRDKQLSRFEKLAVVMLFLEALIFLWVAGAFSPR